jgi:3-isopropylmalate dehydrogenase
VADPVAAVLSISLLLDHLGHAEQARRVVGAVGAELAGRTSGAALRTEEIGDRLAVAVSG